MSTIYVDADFRCFTQVATGRTKVETALLDGKCKTYIEGMRYVPDGASWTRNDGVVFHGPMLSPWKDSALLEAAQSAYEDGIAAMQAQLDAQTARLDETQLALCDVYETLLAGEVT